MWRVLIEIFAVIGLLGVVNAIGMTLYFVIDDKKEEKKSEENEHGE